MSRESLLRGFKAYENPEPRQTHADAGTTWQDGSGPFLTRYNGDGTWRVVERGVTVAGGFDSEREAREWRP